VVPLVRVDFKNVNCPYCEKRSIPVDPILVHTGVRNMLRRFQFQLQDQHQLQDQAISRQGRMVGQQHDQVQGQEEEQEQNGDDGGSTHQRRPRKEEIVSTYDALTVKPESGEDTLDETNEPGYGTDHLNLAHHINVVTPQKLISSNMRASDGSNVGDEVMNSIVVSEDTNTTKKEEVHDDESVNVNVNGNGNVNVNINSDNNGATTPSISMREKWLSLKRKRRRESLEHSSTSSPILTFDTKEEDEEEDRPLIIMNSRQKNNDPDGGSSLQASSLRTAVTLPVHSLQDQSRNDANAEWIAAIEKSGARLFRLRQFQKASRLPIDKYGRACSDWAVKNGVIACCSRSIPTKLVEEATISNANNARAHVVHTEIFQHLSQNLDDLKASRGVTTSKRFVEQREKNTYNFYLNTYRKFAGVQHELGPNGAAVNGLKKGDIIALLVSGPTKKGEVYFGILSSNDLVIRNPDDSVKEGFPAPQLFESQIFNGLMLRRVRWLRHGMVRDLPCQNKGQVSWLAEGGPNWFCEMRPKPDSNSNWIDIMRRNDFLNITQPL